MLALPTALLPGRRNHPTLEPGAYWAPTKQDMRCSIERRYDDYTRALGRAIKRARVRAGLSQNQVAHATGFAIKQQTLSGWERGDLPSLHRLIDFCALTKVSMASLFVEADKIMKKEVNQ